ncbi:MAG: PAS domain-containing protein [Victivallales bacterium]|nr:PAS domain-containing protein [Victivallales bacterium]MCF7889256.1 PAS domain-containing protein [Victivallales bacterium]
MKENFLDTLIKKLDDLDSSNVQAFILRLVKQKGFLETVFNTIKEGIVVVDRYLHIQYANQSAIDLLGFPEKFSDQRISKFLRGVDWKRIMQEDEEEWYRVSRQEIQINYPRRRILNFYIVPHKSEEELATIILTDITERRLSDLENFESEKLNLMSILAASVAHEIGNPLNSLNIHLELLSRHLRENNVTDTEALEMIDISKSEVKRLDLIITQFLSAIRPSKPEMEKTDLKLLIKQTINFISTELDSRSIKVETRWPDYLPDIKVDPNQIKQALYNLIKNASQAVSESGTIQINCDNDEDYIYLSISDTGCGITADDMNNIFEPYFTKKKGGTGLGLMIVERIVREHGALLAVESDPGKGAMFTIKFPLKTQRLKLLKQPNDEQNTKVNNKHE